MRAFFLAILGSLMSWWGLFFIAALDSSMLFFLPFAVDIAIVYMASRSPEFFWLYPILASAGSVCGAAVTFYIGSRLGDAGLKHFIGEKRLDGVRGRIETKGAVALGILALVPPPFPFTACVLAAGALNLSTPVFLSTLFVGRLVRFEAEAALARIYGRRILKWLESDIVEYVVIGLAVVAIVGTVFTIVQFVRKTRAHRGHSQRHRAA